jgi:ADP-ribose pyrophosphatase
MEQKVRTLSSLHANHFTAHLDTVRLRTGRTTERILIDHPEAAAIVAFPDPHHILMVRQWRYAIARETLEIPAGKVDPGETAETCAYRELLEETGYRAGRMVSLFRYFPAIGYSNEVIEIFAASGLRREAERSDLDEIARVEPITLGTVEDLILSGTIQDGKTVLGISLFKARLGRGEIPRDFFE